MAERERRKIEKRKRDGLFHLVGEGSGQKDRRDMRLDDANRIRCVRVG